jgi:branched-chain amino acid transport system permease protein
MGLFFLQLVNGLTIGIIYGLGALGFTMVYKALGLLNFSHSDTIMIGAFLSYTFIVTYGCPIIPTFFITIAIMLFYGVFLEKAIFKRFRKSSPITFMLVSISLSSVVKNIGLLVCGPEPRSLPAILGTKKVEMFGATIAFSNFYILLIALFSLVVLELFFTKTKFGLSIRLASEDTETAGLMGIRVLRVRAATFAITAALGAVAGILVAPMFSITTELGAQLALKIFVAAVVGGVGNLPGAVAGGLLVGVTESLSASFVSSGYKDVIVFTAGILTLALCPLGIFRRVVSKH